MFAVVILKNLKSYVYNDSKWIVMLSSILYCHSTYNIIIQKVIAEESVKRYIATVVVVLVQTNKIGSNRSSQP